jgi:hypothetical protein
MHAQARTSIVDRIDRRDRSGDEVSAGAGMHPLPRLQIDVDLAAGLLNARRSGPVDVQGILVCLVGHAGSRAQVALEVAQKGCIADSYSHGR